MEPAYGLISPPRRVTAGSLFGGQFDPAKHANNSVLKNTEIHTEENGGHSDAFNP